MVLELLLCVSMQLHHDTSPNLSQKFWYSMKICFSVTRLSPNQTFWEAVSDWAAPTVTWESLRALGWTAGCVYTKQRRDRYGHKNEHCKISTEFSHQFIPSVANSCGHLENMSIKHFYKTLYCSKNLAHCEESATGTKHSQKLLLVVQRVKLLYR